MRAMPRKVDRSCDFFVVFGITGDLAKVMTFHSLYRLEQRGLLDCPIVGVAVDDWSDKDLESTPARRSRPLPARSPIRRSSTAWPSGSPTCRATSRTTRPTTASPRRSRVPRSPVFYLEIPPSLFGMTIKGLAGADGQERAVVVEKPFGHDLESARALAEEIHQYINEDQLYRIDHFLGLMG